MNYTVLWGIWALAFMVIEGVALTNSTKGDTLSEHVWAFIGVRPFKADRDNGMTGGGAKVSPKWTLRLARFSVVSGLVWLVIHLTTNWM